LGHQYFPATSQEDVSGDNIDPTLETALTTFLLDISNGFLGATSLGATWYRVTAKDTGTGTQLRPVVAVDTRGYTATIRRRTLPH